MQGESPLAWPKGWKRTARRRRSRFDERLTIARAMSDLEEELRKANARDAVLSTNLQLRLDGLPRSGQRLPDDPGVAVYFKRRGEQLVLACDCWDRVQDNMRAITKHIEAIRGQERWGVGSLDQAFTAYRALPPEGGTGEINWRVELDLVDYDVDEELLRSAYRDAAKRAHPDTGGSAELFKRVQRAHELAKMELGL